MYYFQSDNGCERSTKRRKKRSKVTDVKSTDARDGIERRGKDKALKLSRKQMLRLRKRIVELRLREERESLRKYMNELRNSRPELDSSQTYFCPLEFPNIAGFTEPGDFYNSLAFHTHIFIIDSCHQYYCNFSFKNVLNSITLRSSFVRSISSSFLFA